MHCIAIGCCLNICCLYREKLSPELRVYVGVYMYEHQLNIRKVAVMTEDKVTVALSC